MTKKMTKREMFTTILGVLSALDVDESNIDLAETLIAGVKHEIELLDKKSGSGKVNPKRAAEQVAAKAEIRQVMASGEPMRATAIAAATPSDMSVQRVTALLRQMVADGIVTREQDKKVVTFKVA